MQFLVRGDGNLAVIDCGRRLAAQRDSVIADDVDPHGSVLLIDPGGGAASDPHTRSLRRPKPVHSGQSCVLLGQNGWIAVPGLTRPRFPTTASRSALRGRPLFFSSRRRAEHSTAHSGFESWLPCSRGRLLTKSLFASNHRGAMTAMRVGSCPSLVRAPTARLRRLWPFAPPTSAAKEPSVHPPAVCHIGCTA